MVDVSAKPDTARRAIARGEVWMREETIRLIKDGTVPKGDVLGVARIAAILAAKQTSTLIPLCHPIPLGAVDVTFQLESQDHVNVEVSVTTTGKTGAEMEALTAVATACLTIYDMCKAAEKGIRIEGIRLLHKSGGKSGDWTSKDGGHD